MKPWSEAELAILYSAPTPLAARRELARAGFRRSLQSVRDKRRPGSVPDRYRKPYHAAKGE